MTRLGSGGRLVRTRSARSHGRALTWDKVRGRVWRRDRHECRACQSRVTPNVSANDLYYAHPHHIVKRSQGGADTTANVCTLCSECHARAHAAMSRRLVIHGNADETLNFTCQGRSWRVDVDGTFHALTPVLENAHDFEGAPT